MGLGLLARCTPLRPTGAAAQRRTPRLKVAHKCKQLTWVDCRILGDPDIQASGCARDVGAMAIAVCCGHAIKGVASTHS